MHVPVLVVTLNVITKQSYNPHRQLEATSQPPAMMPGQIATHHQGVIETAPNEAYILHMDLIKNDAYAL